MSAAMRQRVAAAALAWLGTPYHHHARRLGEGVDCVHLICAAYEAAGAIQPVDPGWYQRDWHHNRNAELYIQALEERGAIEVNAPSLGDTVLFRFGRTYSHAGILVSPQEVVHSYIRLGVRRHRLTEAPLAGRAARYWTLPALGPATPPEAEA